jgi:DNA-binding LacI/PurR family transcriptional regulator
MVVIGHNRSQRSTGAVSIRDVAAAAGVSYQTVSRVINGHPSVREATRAHVRATIDELRFRPNRAARALAGGPVESVTVLTGNTTLYGHSAALQGIEEAARSAGYAVGVRVIESASHDEVRDAVRRAVEPGGSLLVIAYDRAGTAALAAAPPEVPMVAMVETPEGDEGAGKPWVWVDDRRAARYATRFLLGLGHRTVHYVSIPLSTDSSQRMAGWRTELETAGAAVPEPAIATWEPRSGYLAGQALAADDAVTAVLCGNDDVALGVMRALHEAGRRVPEDVSVVGFDDIPLAAFFTPALTTVRLDFAGLGRAAFELLRCVVDGRKPAAGSPRPPEPELIVRESAGPPRTAARRRRAPGRGYR